MAAAAKATRAKPDVALEQLDAELLEQLDEARGERSREEWVTDTVRERLERERQESGLAADLDEAPKRGRIRFHGAQYELRNLEEFGPIEQHTLNREGREFAEIWNSGQELSRENETGQRLLMLVDSLFRQVLDAPDEIKAQFSEGERSRVVVSFTVAPARQLAQLAQLIQQMAAEPRSELATTS